MKPIQRPKVHTLKEVYQIYAEKLLKANPTWWGKYSKPLKIHKCYIYAKESGKLVLKMSWELFKEIIQRFYHKCKEAIIQGESLNLGSGIGRIQAIRVERNFSNPVVNWGETYKSNIRDAEGKLVKVYYTNEDYCRIQWQKYGSLQNETNYNFDPAGRNMLTGKGFKREFSLAITKDPFLKYRYKFYNRIPCSTHTSPSEE